MGGGFIGGMLAGCAIKKVIRFAAVILGLFIAGLAYLGYQKIINVDWVRFESVSQNGITWVVETLTHVSSNIGAPHVAISVRTPYALPAIRRADANTSRLEMIRL